MHPLSFPIFPPFLNKKSLEISYPFSVKLSLFGNIWKRASVVFRGRDRHEGVNELAAGEWIDKAGAVEKPAGEWIDKGAAIEMSGS